MDNLNPEQRKRNMQSIKSTDTEIELMLRKELWRRGYRYRKNYKRLPGHPDIVLTKQKIVVFCDGEFFHGKDWSNLKKRLENSVNGEYWISKISENIMRDKEVDKLLLGMGWTVIRFWGDEIKYKLEECIRVIEETMLEKAVIGG